MQLVSANLGGNLHQASSAVNKIGLADVVFAMDSNGHSTIVVFRVEDNVAPKLRKYFGTLPEFRANVLSKDAFNDWSHGGK